MMVHKIDGFSLINIDVPLPTANLLLILLITCLVAFISGTNLTSYAALTQLLVTAIECVKLLVDARIGVRSKARSKHPSELDPKKLGSPSVALASTDAKVIIPGDWETFPGPNRYFLVLDCSRAELRTGRFSIINIAANDDLALFDCLRMLQTLKSRSFSGAVRQLFSLYVPTLAWDMIYYDHQDMLSGHALHGVQPIYPHWYTPLTDKVFPVINNNYLNRVLNGCTRLQSRDDPIVRLLPQRVGPLSEVELHNELIYGPLPALLIERRLSRPRAALALFLLPALAFVKSYLGLRISELDVASDVGIASTFPYFLVATCFLIIIILPPCMEPAVYALDARTIEVKWWPWYSSKAPKAGVHRIWTPHIYGKEVNKANVEIVWKLYQSHIQYHTNRKSRFMGHTKRADPVMASGRNHANRLSLHPMSSLHPRGDPLASETGQDIVDALIDLYSEGEGESSSKIHSKKVQNKESDTKSPRFLIFCSPSSNGSQMYQTKSTTACDRPSDHILIRHIKELYMSNRPRWRRLITLRSFSAIKLSRFELFHSRTSGAIPIALKTWEWPTKPKEGEPKWEYADGSYDPLSEEGIADFMLHKWTNDCSPIKDETEKTADEEQGRTTLSFSLIDEPSTLPRTYPLHIPPSLARLRLPQHIKIWLPNLRILSQDKGKQATKAEIDESYKQWHIEFDYKDTLGDTRYIYHRTPKKLRTPLKPDNSGQNPPIGWGIWIEEDFAVPWYLPLLLTVLSIAILVFSATLSSKQSQKAYAWTIGGCIIAAVALPMGGWMTWAKDSKHTRI